MTTQFASACSRIIKWWICHYQPMPLTRIFWYDVFTYFFKEKNFIQTPSLLENAVVVHFYNCAKGNVYALPVSYIFEWHHSLQEHAPESANDGTVLTSIKPPIRIFWYIASIFSQTFLIHVKYSLVPNTPQGGKKLHSLKIAAAFSKLWISLGR